MITFKEYLRETAVATKRKGLQHLEKMKPLDFIELVQAMRQHFPKNILRNAEINLKVDGVGFRFGRDDRGKPFVESSYSGPVYEPGRFLAYAQEHGNPDMVSRAEKTEEVFDLLMSSRLMQNVPPNRKVICEVLYNPLGEIQQSGGIKFAHTEYDRSKLGSKITISPYDVVVSSTGERAPDAREIVKDLVGLSTPDVKVIYTRLPHEPMDVSGVVDIMQTLTPNAVNVLQSRKKADQPAKEAIAQTIQTAKEQLASILLGHSGYKGLDMLGKQIEGLVLSVGPHEVKVTTPATKQSVAALQAKKRAQ